VLLILFSAGEYILRCKFQVIRFYVVPFCVSSFSGRTQAAGHFWGMIPLEIPMLVRALGVGIGGSFVFLTVHFVLKRGTGLDSTRAFLRPTVFAPRQTCMGLAQGSVRPPLVLMSGCLLYYVVIMLSLPSEAYNWWQAGLVSLLIGTVLNINAFSGASDHARQYISKCKFQIIRFFVVPFCVSSFSARTQASDFWTVIPLQPELLAKALAASASGSLFLLALHCYLTGTLTHCVLFLLARDVKYLLASPLGLWLKLWVVQRP